MIIKKGRYGEKNEGAHMWATVRWSGNQEDSTPPRHPDTSRHLRDVLFHSHQPPGYQLAAPHSTTASYWKPASRNHVY